jgi:hypothetical protein
MAHYQLFFYAHNYFNLHLVTAAINWQEKTVKIIAKDDIIYLLIFLIIIITSGSWQSATYGNKP